MSNIKDTLIEIIAKNFFEIKRKKRTNINKKRKLRNDQNKIIPVSSISAILISSSVKKVKEGKAKTPIIEKDFEVDCSAESPESENDATINGGYGTISKHYGISPIVAYVDYNRIWSHLGTFRTKSLYEDFDEIAMERATNGHGESTREMVSKETMEKAAKFIKYLSVGETLGVVGFVPPFGLNIDSKEWEKYRLMNMMSIYQPLLKLKWSTA